MIKTKRAVSAMLLAMLLLLQSVGAWAGSETGSTTTMTTIWSEDFEDDAYDFSTVTDPSNIEVIANPQGNGKVLQMKHSANGSQSTLNKTFDLTKKTVFSGKFMRDRVESSEWWVLVAKVNAMGVLAMDNGHYYTGDHASSPIEHTWTANTWYDFSITMQLKDGTTNTVVCKLTVDGETSMEYEKTIENPTSATLLLWNHNDNAEGNTYVDDLKLEQEGTGTAGGDEGSTTPGEDNAPTGMTLAFGDEFTSVSGYTASGTGIAVAGADDPKNANNKVMKITPGTEGEPYVEKSGLNISSGEKVVIRGKYLRTGTWTQEDMRFNLLYGTNEHMLFTFWPNISRDNWQVIGGPETVTKDTWLSFEVTLEPSGDDTKVSLVLDEGTSTEGKVSYTTSTYVSNLWENGINGFRIYAKSGDTASTAYFDDIKIYTKAKQSGGDEGSTTPGGDEGSTTTMTTIWSEDFEDDAYDFSTVTDPSNIEVIANPQGSGKVLQMKHSASGSQSTLNKTFDLTKKTVFSGEFMRDRVESSVWWVLVAKVNAMGVLAMDNGHYYTGDHASSPIEHTWTANTWYDFSITMQLKDGTTNTVVCKLTVDGETSMEYEKTIENPTSATLLLWNHNDNTEGNTYVDDLKLEQEGVKEGGDENPTITEIEGSSENALYFENFESGAHSFSSVSAPLNCDVGADPKDSTNKVLRLNDTKDSENGNTMTKNVSFNLKKPVILAGKFLREKVSTSQWWFVDFKLFSGDNKMETFFLETSHIYNNGLQGFAEITWAENTWYPFSITISAIEGQTDKVSLVLDIAGNKYTSTEKLTGLTENGYQFDGFSVWSLNMNNEGVSYLDDLILYQVDSTYDTVMKGIGNGAALSEDDCVTAASFASGLSVLDSMCKDYNSILKYAKGKGYDAENKVKNSVPAANAIVNASDVKKIVLEYRYPLATADGWKAEVKSDSGTTVLSSAEIKGRKLTVSLQESLKPSESYTVSVSGLKDFAGNAMKDSSLKFQTNIMPSFNVVDGDTFDIGAKLSWEVASGVAAEVKLAYNNGEAVVITNGYEITQAGSYVLTCTATKGEATETLTVHFTGRAQHAPTASDVSVSGVAKIGEKLKGNYTYSDAEHDKEKNSIYYWLRCAEKDGTYTEIDGACGTGEDYLTYTLTEADAEHYIKFAVVPVADSLTAQEGKKVFSKAFATPFRPVVSNVSISGTAKVGQTISGYYDYYDANGDEETEDSVLEWIDANGKVIATGTSLELTSGMEGDKIAFRVTAVSTGEPEESETVTSSYVTVGKKSSGSSGGSGSNRYSGSGIGSKQDTTVTPSKPSENVPSTNKGFGDTKNHWAKNEIEKLYEAGIINGISEEEFAPEKTVTRAEMLAMILRALKIEMVEYAGSFGDVSADDWFSGYVEAALAAGIISADDNFRPNAPITREETAKLIANILKNVEKKVADFADADAISEWAAEFVEAVYGSGIMKGDDEGNFRPHDSLTRGEAAAVIYRAIGGNNE